MSIKREVIIALYLNICRIAFDISFFYTLMSLFWNIEALVLNKSPNSIMHGLMVAVVLYHLFKSDRLKIIMLMGIIIINVGILIFAYSNAIDVAEVVAIISIASALMAFVVLAIWTYVHRCEKDRLSTYAKHVWKGGEENL